MGLFSELKALKREASESFNGARERVRKQREAERAGRQAAWDAEHQARMRALDTAKKVLDADPGAKRGKY